MTVREVYEATLVEINKENAQSFTIEEFNYIVNKAILSFVNEKYNFYAANQQLSDDLRVLVKNQTFSMNDTTDVDPGNPTVAVFNATTSYLTEDLSSATTATLNTTRDLVDGAIIRFGESTTPYTISDITGNEITFSPAATVIRGTSVLVSTDPVSVSDDNITGDRVTDLSFISSDYLHLISCRVLWKTKRPSTNEITHLVFPAKRLTYDMMNAIQNNTYLKPAPNRPYYQLFDNTNNSGITNLDVSADDYRAYQNKPRSKVHIGIKDSVMELRSIEFDYLKMPETVTIYDADIFSAATDSSQVLEFPDYLLNEIVRRCTIYLLEKAGDPRVQSQPTFNTEIPSVPMNMQLGGMGSNQQPERSTQ